MSASRIMTTKPRILRLIHDSGPLSRAELSRALSLSSSIVSEVTRDLLSLGILKETVTSSKPLGRPAVLLDIVPDYGYVIGATLTGSPPGLVLVDLAGKPAAAVYEVDIASTDPRNVVSSLVNQVKELVEKACIPDKRLLAIGIGVSGIVDRNTGVCKRSTVLGWDEVPLRDMLQENLQLPVFVDNDANTLAMAENLFGELVGYSDAAVVTVGRGIGAGFLHHHDLYTGRFGGAGEIGHCTVDRDGPVCRCGKKGCLEAVASVPAMMAQAQENLRPAPRSFAELVSQALQGDAAALAILERAGDAIGLAVSYIVNLLNPQAVLVTSCDVDLSFLEPAILESLERNAFRYLLEHTRVKVKCLHRQSWALGAASIAVNELLQNPSLLERRREVNRYSLGSQRQKIV
jgi:predicted NBD/HSP70 family sugar kinase